MAFTFQNKWQREYYFGLYIIAVFAVFFLLIQFVSGRYWSLIPTILIPVGMTYFWNFIKIADHKPEAIESKNKYFWRATSMKALGTFVAAVLAYEVVKGGITFG